MGVFSRTGSTLHNHKLRRPSRISRIWEGSPAPIQEIFADLLSVYVYAVFSSFALAGVTFGAGPKGAPGGATPALPTAPRTAAFWVSQAHKQQRTR
eukprot:8735648-Pyramimonas_sp.AAC.1